jgi:hypothetical protein
MSVSDLNAARQGLAAREGSQLSSIGVWNNAPAVDGQVAKTIGEWALTKNIDAVVWTALTSGLTDGHNSFPTYGDVLSHLRDLPHERRRVAEEYVCRAPRQIDTEYRRGFERDLGWRPKV